MELRLLQSFLVLSQELHFGRAAARLHIAQPPLTKQIHQLEKQLGVQLFERHPRGVRLTPAGEALVPDAEQIFAAVDSAVHNVRHAEHGGVGHLVLGFSGATGTALVPGMLRAIAATSPGVDLDVKRYANSSQVADGVVDGELDLGHVLLPFSHADLSTRSVAHHRPVLVVARDHPLADRQSVRVTELENENFITPRRYSGSALLQLIQEVCATGGFTPRVVKETPDAYTTLMLVAGGLGVSITVTGVDVLSLEVRYIPFEEEKDLPVLESAVAWRTKNPSRLLEKAVDSVVSPPV
ncbi:LysR substrate-binding domain-containing protein [Kocuria arenosa]|uniref:LysR substrate-binding domain-containing protein n=1 Tax=Kocuria arenosa TaxID=3071446 RepID=UPI0034D41FCB